jgi:DNA-directed RNA polymerase subunit omega
MIIMMLKPSYTDLMEVVNSGVEEGADPIIQSRYSNRHSQARQTADCQGGSVYRFRQQKAAFCCH